MCGRYNFTAEESAELREIVRRIETNNARADWHMGEIYPTNAAPVLLWQGQHILPELLGWGFPGFKGNRGIINARAETAAERPMFRKSLEERRCVIPSSGFYEWDRAKNKYLFHLREDGELYMAGVWNEFGGSRRFCIVTTAANESISDIHDRMPLVLPKKRVEDWLRDRGAAEAILHAVPPILARKEVSSSQMKLW